MSYELTNNPNFWKRYAKHGEAAFNFYSIKRLQKERNNAKHRSTLYTWGNYCVRLKVSGEVKTIGMIELVKILDKAISDRIDRLLIHGTE